jgi:hypothetical protein
MLSINIVYHYQMERTKIKFEEGPSTIQISGQMRRSLVRSQMVSLDFSVHIILSDRTMALGST